MKGDEASILQGKREPAADKATFVKHTSAQDFNLQLFTQGIGGGKVVGIGFV